MGEAARRRLLHLLRRHAYVTRLRFDPRQPGGDRGKTGEVEAAFSGDVGVAIKRDVGNGISPRCQEWFVGKLVLHHCQRAIPAVAFAFRQCTL